MAAEKPTIVFIPGCWHGPAYFGKVCELLGKYGYETRALHLPSAGKDLKSTSHDDAAFIQKTTLELADQGKDIVLVMHSYGGIPGTDSVKGLRKEDRQGEGKTGGVIALVYLCAFVLPEGQSMLEFYGENIPEWSSVEGEVAKAARTNDVFYNDLPPAEANKWSALLNEHGALSLTTPVTYAAYKYLPTTYLLCRNDNCIPVSQQQQMIDTVGEGVTKHECDASHSPMLSMPETVTSTIRQAAGELLN